MLFYNPYNPVMGKKTVTCSNHAIIKDFILTWMCFPFTAEATIVTHHEEEEVDDQGEAELQITAAVMDLTGDSDIEEAEPHDEDYNSYELDDSDAVLGKFCTLEFM